MARPLRIEFPGAFYHITSRGNKRHNIFTNHEDRNLWINILAKVVKIHGWICYAFCLMDNHYHLVIQTPHGDLSKGMRDLNGMYTQFFNETHQTTGHIYQGRYKAFVIEKGEYFFEAIRYTVLNPVRANMVKHAKEWPWSSYKVTAYGNKMYPFVDQKLISKHFSRYSKTENLSRERFRKFVQEGIDKDSPFKDARHGTILGSDRFMFEIWEQYVEKEEEPEVKLDERRIARPSLEEIFKEVKTMQERNDAIVFARMRCRYSITAIAKHLKMHRSTVSVLFKENCKIPQSTT